MHSFSRSSNRISALCFPHHSLFCPLKVVACLPLTVKVPMSTHAASRRVLVPVAHGSEDIETVSLIDVFRRAKYHVDVASVEHATEVTLARGCHLRAEMLIDEAKSHVYDLIALPGGMPGAEHLRDSSTLTDLLRKQAADGKYIAAICASPAVVFAHHGLLEHAKAATCHPGFVDKLGLPVSTHARVVVDKHIITSRGPGTSIEFALQCIACLDGVEKAKEVATPMVMHDGLVLE